MSVLVFNIVLREVVSSKNIHYPLSMNASSPEDVAIFLAEYIDGDLFHSFPRDSIDVILIDRKVGLMRLDQFTAISCIENYIGETALHGIIRGNGVQTQSIDNGDGAQFAQQILRIPNGPNGNSNKKAAVWALLQDAGAGNSTFSFTTEARREIRVGCKSEDVAETFAQLAYWYCKETSNFNYRI